MLTRRSIVLSSAALLLAPLAAEAQTGVRAEGDLTCTFRFQRPRADITITIGTQNGTPTWATATQGSTTRRYALRVSSRDPSRLAEAVAASGGAITIGRQRYPVAIRGGERPSISLTMPDGSTGTGETTRLGAVAGFVIVVLIITAGIVAITAIAGAQGTEVSAGISADEDGVRGEVSVTPQG